MRANPMRANAPGEFVPPHDIGAEQSVLGAMLIEAAAIATVAEILTVKDFYRDGHQALFDVVLHLSAKQEPVDLVTVPAEVTRRGVLDRIGGMAYLAVLFDTVPTAANVSYYAKIVRRHGDLRRLLAAGLEVQRLALSEPEEAADALDAAERVIFAQRREAASEGLRPLAPSVMAVYEEAERRAGADGDEPPGLMTGLTELDNLLVGIGETDLVIVAARPSMGKSASVLAMVDHVAVEQGKRVAFFSNEMSREQIATRMLCGRASVNSNLLKRPKSLSSADWGRLAAASGRLYDMPLFVDDAREATVLSMRSRCRRMASEGGLSLIVVDYLQNMAGGKAETRNLELEAVCRQLRALAQEVKAPVILLSQLSRAVESRENKRPMLSDLRDSGGIENSADMVIFLYNESYYKKDKPHPFEEDGRPVQEEVEMIVAKNRNGATGTAQVGFVRPFARFESLKETGF